MPPCTSAAMGVAMHSPRQCAEAMKCVGDNRTAKGTSNATAVGTPVASGLPRAHTSPRASPEPR